MGVLTIVSDASGLIENVVHGKTGWVVPKRRSKLLAKKITQIISMENKKLNTIRLNAINRTQDRFNLINQTKQFNKFFNENIL